MSWERNYYKRKELSQSSYVRKKNEANLKIESLSNDQHEQIQELCEMRHLLHCGNTFSTVSSDFERCQRYFWEQIEIVGIGTLDLSFDFEELTTDIDLEFEYFQVEECDREAYDVVLFDLVSKHNEQIEAMNSKIEAFLNDIDLKYGTKYCPTGKSRNKA